MIEQYLNVRYSTRNLPNSEFDKLLPTLAKELTQVDFLPHYTEDKLRKDWNELKKWSTTETFINSTSRLGMKLCEHFMPNFYDIEDNRGNSFRTYWQDSKLLEKVLTGNRKSHSTPYLSELKRGIYFATGMPKSTMYRPQMSKMITTGAEYVLDPCAGWGGRMLGAVANGAHYIAFEPNPITFANLNKMIDFLDIKNNVTLYCDDARNIDTHNIPKVDVVLTSPPYFDLEIYCKDNNQSVQNCTTYEDWDTNFLTIIISKCIMYLKADGKSCWNVANFGKNDMWASVDNAHETMNFERAIIYENKSSARPTIKSDSKSKKSDITVSYTRR